MRDEIIHTTAEGRRLLIMQGDKFDRVVQNGRGRAMLGARLHDRLLGLNRLFNAPRRRLGLNDWSPARSPKHSANGQQSIPEAAMAPAS